MSSSTRSHPADFCCHAATHSHSIIPRSIKRCGYPGRRVSCLGFRSRRSFPLPFSVSAVSQHPVPRHLLPPSVSSTTPSPPVCLSLLHPHSSLLPEFPAVMMSVLDIRGNPCSPSLSRSFSCSGLLFFTGHNLISNIQPVKAAALQCLHCFGFVCSLSPVIKVSSFFCFFPTDCRIFAGLLHKVWQSCQTWRGSKMPRDVFARQM